MMAEVGALFRFDGMAPIELKPGLNKLNLPQLPIFWVKQCYRCVLLYTNWQ